MNKRPRLHTPRSGPDWREGRDARRDREEAAMRALGEIEEAAWLGHAWHEFRKLETYYLEAS